MMNPKAKCNSGIYLIKCIPTGLCYVGMTEDFTKNEISKKKNLNRNKPLGRTGKYKHPKLQNSWNKYGEESFEWKRTYIEKPKKLSNDEFRAFLFKEELKVWSTHKETLNSVEPNGFGGALFNEEQKRSIGLKTIERFKDTNLRSLVSKVNLKNKNAKGLKHTEEWKKQKSIQMKAYYASKKKTNI